MEGAATADQVIEAVEGREGLVVATGDLLEADVELASGAGALEGDGELALDGFTGEGGDVVEVVNMPFVQVVDSFSDADIVENARSMGLLEGNKEDEK